MTINEAKAIDMVSFLTRHGIEPAKVKGMNYWYLSPLRQEQTPSFKINRTLNCWYDYGDGRGGNLLDFVLTWKRCTIPDALDFLRGHRELSSAPQSSNTQQPSIEITAVQSLHSPALMHYYRSRRIADDIAAKYLCEIRYKNGDRPYYAMGFKNDAGGYELRNPYFKGGSSPKSPTLLQNNASSLAVFEGAFDLLSYLTIYRPPAMPHRDYLVLNTLSFFEQQLPIMQQYQRVHLYLDNDVAADKRIRLALQQDPAKFIDERSLYKGYKDLNEWHQQIGKHREHGNRERE